MDLKARKGLHFTISRLIQWLE